MAVRLMQLSLWFLLAAMSGCCARVPQLYPPAPDAPSTEMFIYNNHWHTGLVLSRESLSPVLKTYLSRFADAKYVEIGWGDEGFYRASKGTLGKAFHAAFFSRGTVVHVVGLTREPVSHYRELITDLYRIRISEAGRERLMSFLERSFATAASGDSIELQPGLYGVSYFYKGRGHYGALYTCNNWVAEAIRQTGFPITPIYAALADNVAWQLRVFGRRYEPDITVLRQ